MMLVKFMKVPYLYDVVNDILDFLVEGDAGSWLCESCPLAGTVDEPDIGYCTCPADGDLYSPNCYHSDTIAEWEAGLIDGLAPHFAVRRGG